MKVSSSGPPEPDQPARTAPSRSSRALARAAPWLLAAAVVGGHLPTLAPSLEDIDSTNFALGLRDFDPAQHQPHPPGYPVYVAAGRLALASARAVGTVPDRAAAEALALSLLSVLAAAVAVIAAGRVFELLALRTEPGARARVRFWAAALLAACPLYWVTAVRPMSDMPGLAAALAAQAWVLGGRLHAGAFLAGLALGVRSQTFWLTAPLIALALVRVRGERAWRTRGLAVASAAGGALLWAIPLVAATGGLDAYLTALGGQAGEDFAFVDMFWANPTPRRLAFGLVHTLVLPWGSYPFAGLVLALAVSGGIVMLLRERGTLALLAAAFGPYALFHLVFQETVTVRYALPTVAAVTFLAARAAALAGPLTNVVATPLAVLALLIGTSTAARYAAEPHPAFRAIADADRRAAVEPPALMTSHFELRRALRAAEPLEMPVTYAPHRYEWLELVRYWTGGGKGPVWFFASPRRTDTDLIDPHSLRDVVRYRWRVSGRPELSGTRPDAVDWYRLRQPGWFLGEGWSVTPETGGLALATRSGIPDRPIAGYVRQRAEPMHAVIGGRHLGSDSDPPVDLELALADAVVDRWTVTAADPSFLRFVEMPQGIPGSEGEYATLIIRAAGPGGSGSSPASAVAIRRFDVQPTTRVIFGFGSGWHDDEFDVALGLRWRWTSDRAVLRVRAPAGPVRVRLRGESPLRYFDGAPTLTMAAGGRIIARLQPSSDWEWDVVVPADAMAAGRGDLVLQTTHVFVPLEVMGTPDTRRLGLRIFAVDVETAR